jgi:hypothetical protein
MPVQELKFEGKCKFVWDGALYAARAEAETRRREYEAQGFAVREAEHEGQWVLYTRREAAPAPAS